MIHEYSPQLLLRLADVRIIAFGVLHRPTSLFVSPNAQLLLNPPGAPRPRSPLSMQDDDISQDDNDDEDSGEEAEELSHFGPQSVPNTSSPLLELARRARASSLVASRPTPSTGMLFFRTLSRDGASDGVTTPQASNSSASPPTSPTRRNFLRFLTSGSQTQEPPRVSLSSSTQTANPVPARRAQIPHPIAESSPHVTLRHPTPHPTHRNYPNHTPPSDGGRDWRWYKEGDELEEKFRVINDNQRVWVGPMMCV